MDYSNIKINGQSITKYRPTKYILNYDHLFNPSFPFKFLIALCILDNKGSVRVIEPDFVNRLVHIFGDMDFIISKDGGTYTFSLIPVHNQLSLDYSTLKKTAN